MPGISRILIRDASDVSGLAWPATTYACTLVLSRGTWALLSYYGGLPA